jgi:hypothetical protein
MLCTQAHLFMTYRHLLAMSLPVHVFMPSINGLVLQDTACGAKVSRSRLQMSRLEMFG